MSEDEIDEVLSYEQAGSRDGTKEALENIDSVARDLSDLIQATPLPGKQSPRALGIARAHFETGFMWLRAAACGNVRSL